MDPSTFQAGTTGRVVTAGGTYRLDVHDLGALHLPSGELGVCDPFVSLLDALTFAVPAGTYPVQVTVADVSDDLDGSHLREAYLSLVVAPGEVARTEHLVPLDRMAPEEGFHGVVVDSGTVAFVDSARVLAALPGDEPALEALFEGPGGWFVQLDDPAHLRSGCANIDLPGSPDRADVVLNVVLSHAGWGDGCYAVVGTYDAEFRLLGVHIDLEVVT